MTTNFFVKFSFTRFLLAVLIAFAEDVVTKMTAASASFPNIVPTLASITTKIGQVRIAMEAASNGDRQKIAERNQLHFQLLDLMRQLGRYVDTIAMGNKDTILKAGFATSKQREPIGRLSAPATIIAVLTLLTGRLEVRFPRVYGAKLYLAQYTKGDPSIEANWSAPEVLTRARFIKEGLDSQEYYYVRVAAVGTAGQSEWSDLAHVLVA